jgi:virginiamycin B lyase
MRRWVLGATSALAVAFSSSLHAQSPDAALTGKVGSAGEAALEGVLVSAKAAKSPVTITVVTRQDGRYEFPAARLPPGEYTLSIRAVGYELAAPVKATVRPLKTTTADLTLGKAKDLAGQLSNAEWIASVPGTDAQKATLLGCVGCHTLQRPLYSTHSAEEFADVLRRMASYAQVSQPEHPQVKPYAPAANAPAARFQAQAEWLASINLSESKTWKYPLKTFARPTGRATRVIITEYDLPRHEIQPHDVITDARGTVWYSNFSQEILSSLDPNTGKITEYKLPVQKPDYPEGSLALRSDANGDLWLGMMFQGAVARFDPHTKELKVWNLPADRNNDGTQINMVSPERAKVDGKVWLQDTGKLEAVHRLDLASGTFQTFEPFKNAPPDAPFPAKAPHVLYDAVPDSHNNVYFTDLLGQEIGRIDAATGAVKFWATPTPNSNTRRGSMDSQDRFWFGEHRGNRIAMFDPETEKIQEWEAPVPWSAPYDVAVDKTGNAWSGGMTSDRVLRLDPKTGEMVAYLLPRETNIRRVFVDNSTERPTFWVGNNHGASIVRVEPLD